MKKTNPASLAEDLGISESRSMEAVVKAELISAVLREVERAGITHAELAKRSGLGRSTVTGVLSGSLQRVTIDRILRLVAAAGLEAHVKVKRAA